MTPDLDFATLRAEGGDRREGFEEFSAQIFRRLAVTSTARFERYRGAGGDGGVEAVWRLASGEIIALQSKFFLPLKNAHLTQLEKSLDTAIDNFPRLRTYIVTLPFDPTPTVVARKGLGESEKLEAWRKALVARAAARGLTIDVEWWMKSELKSRLLAMDNAPGRILYWFGKTLLDQKSLLRNLVIAEKVAGKRYSPKLRVGMTAQETLLAFGLENEWLALQEEWNSRIDHTLDSWTSRAPKGHPIDSQVIVERLKVLAAQFEALSTRTFGPVERKALEDASTEALQAAERLSDVLKTEFDNTHGADSDTPGWRQFQAEYMAGFPAAELDLARDAVSLFRDLLAFAISSRARAAGASVLLMRGSAGIGKTHTTIDAAKARVEAGKGAIVILGEEITLAKDPWAILAEKLDMGANATKVEITGVLAARAESDGAPFVLMIDAINETADRHRWRAWLPDFLVSVEGQPIRLLLTCRDIYVVDALDSIVDEVVSFTHDGFSGREYDAAYAFAAFYGVGPPAEVIAQPEFANPLFLHLVCRAAQARNWATIPGGQISLTSLIAAILDGANAEAAKQLDFDPRVSHPVRAGAMALAGAMAAASSRTLDLATASQILQTLFVSSGASTSLLRAMETADLITVGDTAGVWTLRFAFERLGDILIAQSSLDGQDQKTVERRFTSGDLAGLIVDKASVAENAGLIQAYSIILPEMFGIELADQVLGPVVHREVVRLALGVLAWRDAASFGAFGWFTTYLTRPNDIAEIFDQLLAVAAIATHPLNIDWLSVHLYRLQMVDRDAMWNHVVATSWENKGSVRRLVDTALEQDLSHLSRASARRLGTALVWFTACSGRQIREEATEALTRLLVHQDVAPALVSEFGGFDDDYIVESLLAAVYGAGLLRNDTSYWAMAGATTFRAVFQLGSPPQNVLIRDLARLVVEEADKAGVLDASMPVNRARPPYISPWPLSFNDPDWAAIATRYSDYPSNMLLGRHALATDFARYQIKPQAEAFDLDAIGLDLGKLYQWVFEQTIAQGYPGQGDMALEYDRMLVATHGQGRGRRSTVERLGKKYARIHLACLLGRLHDHAPFRSSTWSPAPAPTALQGIELRSVDPTRLSATKTLMLDIELWRLFPPMAREAFSLPINDWTPIGGLEIGVLTDDDDPWVVLSGSQSLHKDDDVTGHSRSIRRFVHAVSVSAADLVRTRKALRATPFSINPPELRDLYMGEYPASVGFTTPDNGWLPDRGRLGDDMVVNINGIEGAAIDQPSRWAPAPAVFQHTTMTWDGDRGWLDDDARLVAVHVDQGGVTVMLMRKSKVESFLTSADASLIWLISESRNASVNHDPKAYEDRDSAWEWRRGATVKVAEHFQRHPFDESDKADEEEDA